jgi:hypothetical protein
MHGTATKSGDKVATNPENPYFIRVSSGLKIRWRATALWVRVPPSALGLSTDRTRVSLEKSEEPKGCDGDLFGDSFPADTSAPFMPSGTEDTFRCKKSPRSAGTSSA